MGAKKKRRSLIIICIILIIAAAAVVLALFLMRQRAETPEERFTAYTNCMGRGDYEGMYDFLDADSMNGISREDFVSKNQNIYEGIEASGFSFQVTETDKISKSETRITYETSMETVAGTIEFVNESTWTLDEEQNVYRLHWDTTLIFTSLGAGDKVRVHTLTAQRGSIYDRGGTLLAGPGMASSVGLVPGKVTDQTDMTLLAELLSTTVETIEKELSASWVKDDSFVPIKTIKKSMGANPDAEAEALQDALLQIPGVMISDTEARTYPYGEIAAHLTGYVQKATAEDLEADTEGVLTENSLIGKVGLEALYEDRLRAIDGAEIVILDENGEQTETLALKKAQDGEDIKLTVDIGIQQALYAQYAVDKSCSVAMNPKTGEVLALVSTPAYDPNAFLLGMSNEKWAALNENADNPLYNRFRAALVPGSSFKPVTAAIGLSTGVIDPNEDVGASGLSWQKDSSWGSYFITTLHTYAPATLKNALIHSDNIYFAKAALKIGAETLTGSLGAIGFNEAIPFDIVMSPSVYSGDDTITSEIQLADSGYGQGQIQVNALHLAAIYSAFVNNGSMIQPYLEDGAAPAARYWLENAFTADAANTVLDALLAVVEDPNGTGHAAEIAGLSLAGKTGTAEIKQSQDDTEGTELGWFCAMTTDQSNDESVLIVSMVEDVKNRGGSGYLLNKSRAVFQSIFS